VGYVIDVHQWQISKKGHPALAAIIWCACYWWLLLSIEVVCKAVRPSLTVDTECLSCTYFRSESGVSFRHSWLRRVNLLLLCCSVSGGDAEYLSVYACLCVTLLISQKPHILTSPNFVCKLPVSVAQPSSDGTATCYLLPVLWKTSFLYNVPYSSMTAAAATSLQCVCVWPTAAAASYCLCPVLDSGRHHG